MNENDFAKHWPYGNDGSDFDEHWAKLNEHLVEVYPIVQAFCDRHGFAFVNRTALGRYPRVRIVKGDFVPATAAGRLVQWDFFNIWIDLWMELDEQGERFGAFRRDLPYELSAGTCLDSVDESGHGFRLSKALLCFKGKPFDEVVRILADEMERCLPTIESWNVDFLKQHGRRSRLGGSSNS